LSQAALFLDRDGVINEDSGYTYRIDGFVFVPGIFELCRHARAAGLRIFVITNQAGIGRGLYSEDDFQALTRWMLGRFVAAHAPIDKVYHCPYHPQEGLGAYRRESEFRKPNPGMILRARDEFALDLAHSLLVGDKSSDIEAGRRAGVGRNLLLARGASAPAAAADAVIHGLDEAIAWIGPVQTSP
jgi:D-glycero-D-manno-heptose 1,7-bisphosphate phosphatase